MTRLSVVGLGKLGVCTAACLASKGFEVVGVDICKDTVDAINNAKAHIFEPELQDLLTKSKGKIRATQDYAEAIEFSDITFLIVPTPSKQDGHFSDAHLCDAIKGLSAALKSHKKDSHLFVVTSTVSPGTTERNLIPLIELISQRKLNKGFEVCYNPEFIALGSIINDYLKPNLVVIGQSSKNAGEKLEAVFKVLCESKPYIAKMSLISAEITKISLNSYITMKISFANTLAVICENATGADVDDITRALGADKRVSPYFLKAGLSYGGPCFPRDNRAFVAFARNCGIDALLAKSTDAVNNFHNTYLAERVLQQVALSGGSTAAVLGLSYKPNTPVIEESASIKLIEQLLANEVDIVVYDSLAMDITMDYFGSKVQYASSVKDCFVRSSVCVIATQEEEFRKIDDSYIHHNPTTIIDCWRIIDPSKLGGKVKYTAIGTVC